jgi:drug/metabolite transporter (DMT)-like permease
VLTRRLAGIDHGTSTLFIGGLVATLLLCALVPFYWRTPESLVDLALLVCTGAVGAGGHLMLVRAYERASATTLAPYGYSHTVAALPLAYLVFGTFPHGLALAGMLLIVGSGVAMAISRR